MATAHDAITAPHKLSVRVDKYENHRTPEDGEPDEVVTSEQWYEGDGSPVTDPERIAALDASVQEGETE